MVVISNQSGIARRLYPETDYHRVQAHLEELLQAGGARIDAALFCPHHPDFTGPCDCRKPGTKLFLEAAQRFQVEPARSWFVGDQASDVAPTAALGGRGLLVLTGKGGGLANRVQAVAAGVRIVTDLAAAVDVILGPVA